ncbi:MAG: DegT/DnrJ/EryC1/StrS family aminotransferase [Thermomonas sp.]
MTLPDIPVNSLKRHVAPLQEALAACAADVIGNGHFVLGPGVAEFENAFARYCGVDHCVGVGNGTDALELSLKAVGVQAGDRVAVVANAAMYGTSSVLACGALPVFVDVEPGIATMSIACLDAVLAAEPGIKAVIITHLYGRLAQIEALVALCADRGIAVIEDCAQAHGAQSPDGRRAGAFGDVASYSFYPTKNLGALGDGGAVVTRDPAIADRTRKLRQYGWTQKYTNGLAGGRNSRLDEIQARALLLMLPLLDGWNRRRRHIANHYSSEIRNTGISVPPVAGEEFVGHLYVVRSDRRQDLRHHLAASGIQTDVHYPLPDHRQPCHEGRYDAVSLPITEADAASVLTLPCFPEMTDDEVQRVVDSCNRF